MPFLPLYIAELGVTDVGQVAMWTGLTLGLTPAVTAVSAPLWGRVGDRFGTKVLVVRSLAAFVVTMGAMAFVTLPWHLVALRALLGIFAGYGALTVSMAAQSVPRERMPSAIGKVQVAQRLGPAIGPALGGLLAPIVGLRRSFLVTAAFYLCALLVILIFYQEPRTHRAPTPPRSLGHVVSHLLRLPGFVLLLAVILSLQLVDRSFAPILPLFVAELGGATERVATISGALFSVAACCAAVGHWIAGPLLIRFKPRHLIPTAAIATALAIALLLLVPSVWAFAGALAIGGAAIGIGMTAAYSVTGALLPGDAQATGFGLVTSASLVGMAVSPVVAGLLGAEDLENVFVADALMLVLLAGVVWRRMEDRPVSHRRTTVSDASVS
jgi:DHA1 family multidrug resistance protein-like MFS transporter